MSGETCPRCRHRIGYPITYSILRANKMDFVCKDCGHRWQKRNTSGGIPARWFMYGIGFIIGTGFRLYELFNIFFKDKTLFFIEKDKELFENFANIIKSALCSMQSNNVMIGILHTHLASRAA